MLKNLGKTPFLLKFGQHVFVCMADGRLQGGVRERIRPWKVGPLACWFDRSSSPQR